MPIFVNEDTEKEIVKALMLLEENECTSASNPGLILRGENRRKAIEILLGIIGMEADELERLYQLK